MVGMLSVGTLTEAHKIDCQSQNHFKKEVTAVVVDFLFAIVSTTLLLLSFFLINHFM